MHLPPPQRAVEPEGWWNELEMGRDTFERATSGIFLAAARISLTGCMKSKRSSQWKQRRYTRVTGDMRAWG